MRVAFALAMIVALVLPPAAMAQAQPAPDAETLADIRRELGALSTTIAGLRAELVPTQTTVGGVGTTGSVLDRVNAIEQELTRLIGKTEALEIRIERVVADGTNRIGDLEFRLIELEGGDLSTVGTTLPLGGEAAAPAAPRPAPTDGALLAVGERADFERARAAFDAGDYAAAITGFGAFVEAYPGGPLTTEATFLRAHSHSALGEHSQAARAYLDVFNMAADGPFAPEALFRLGQSLGVLGQVQEGCLMFDEVAFRFPASEFVEQLGPARRELGCL
jgi:tol-pal system protein YbgF